MEKLSLHSAFAELRKLRGSNRGVPTTVECIPPCDGSTTRTNIPYTYDFGLGDGVDITVSKDLPGHHCPSCSTEYYDPTLRDRFLKATASGLAKLGDLSLRRLVDLRGANPTQVSPTSPIPPEVAKVMDAPSDQQEKLIAELYQKR